MKDPCENECQMDLAYCRKHGCELKARQEREAEACPRHDGMRVPCRLCKNNERDGIALAAELFFSINREQGVCAVAFTRTHTNHIKALPPVELLCLPMAWRSPAANT